MYDEQDIKPSRSFDDIDREIRGQQRPPALKPPKPVKSFDDIDREVRSQSSPDVVQYPQNPKVGQTIPLRGGITMTYAGDPKDRPAQPPHGSMGWTGEDTDAQGKPTGRGMVYHKPVAAPGEFKSPINMDFRAPTEVQKMADRALQAPSAFQASRPKSTFERIQDQQALEMRQPQTVETDPIRLAQLQRETAEYQARKQRQQAEATTSRNQTLRKIGGALNPAIGLGNALNDAGVPDVNRVLQSGGKSVGSIVRGAAAASTMYPGAEGMYKFITGSSLRDTADRYGRQAEHLTNQASEALLPEQEQDQSFRAKIERGAGSMLPPVGAALATGGGSAMAAGVGALANLGQVASERDQSGVPVSDTRRAMSDTMAVATGMTEALGIGRLLNRVGLKTPLIHRVAQMVEEGGQEYAQDYLNDINAKLVAAYDPQRQINDPLAAKRLESAAIGAILGGAGEVADVGAQRIQQQVQNRAAVRSVANERPNLPTDIRPTTLGPTQVTTVPGARPATSAQPAVDAQPHTAQNDFQKHFALRYQNGQFTLDEAIPLEQAPPQNVKALVDVLQGFQTKPDVPPEMAGAAQNLLQQVQSRLSQTTPASSVAEPSPAFPRLPEPEGFNARRAKLLGMEVPPEIAINERIAQADKLLGSQNENDQRLGKRILKQSLEEIQKSEGYQGELGQLDDAPKPYTAVRQAIEEKLSKKFSESQNSLAKVSLKNETTTPAESAVPLSKREDARLKAIEFEQQAAQQVAKSLDSGRFRDAQDGLRRQKDALAQQRRLIDRSTVEGQTEYRRLGDQIQGVQRQQEAAKVQARQMARQANAPTRGLARPEIQQTQPFIREKAQNQANAGPAESAPLLRTEAVQNPEGGIPQMPEQTFSGRLQQAISRQEAQKSAVPAKRLISRIKELGGIDSRHVGEMQGLKDARNVGVIRNGAKMSPDVLARQLQSEGYDIDPENLNTLWAAIDRDVAGKNERPANTADLNQRLKQEEEAHYAKQQPTKSFDQIAADVDSETGALQRAIDRSNEREHAMPSEGVGLVSMSPYADMVARNRDAVDRLYQSGMASQEGKEVFRNLREFAAKNGIEARHLHALADDVRNFELEKARWADRGIDFSTVQSLDEGTARLRDSVLEDAKSLPSVERTALEREVAALDTFFNDLETEREVYALEKVFSDTEIVNLLERAAEGDNNAANEFRKVASEYGIGTETIGELIEARKPNRSANRAPGQTENGAPESSRRDTRTAQKREARSATPEEFDLLNRNPATIPKDEFDAHLTAMEKLRNDEIRGIVKLSRDDKREMFRQLRNLNEERKFRVQRKELPAKFESRTLPVDKEFVRQSVEKATQPKASETKIDRMVIDEADKLREEWGVLRQFPESDMEGALDNARIQTSTDPANDRAGIIYINTNAKMVLDSVWQSHTGSKLPAAVAMDSAALDTFAQVLRHEASFLDGREAKQVNALADAFEKMSGKDYDGAGLLNVDLAKQGHYDVARNHEMFHLWQYGQSAPNDPARKPMNVGWAEKVNGYEKVRDSLLKKGYSDDAEDIVREFAAYAATNDLERLGFSKPEAETVATDFLYEYFSQISKQYGADHLERIGRISIPARAVAERVRNEVRSTQTTSRTTGESRVGQQEPRSAGSVAASGIRLPEGTGTGRRSGSEASDTANATPQTPRTRESVENSPEFKRWFGDSKVVDENGKPLMVYHGTQSSIPIDEIDLGKLDANAMYGPGFYTTQDYNVASGEGGYASEKQAIPFNAPYHGSELVDWSDESKGYYIYNEKGERVTEGGIFQTKDEAEKAAHEWARKDDPNHPHAYPLYLSIKNPFRMDDIISSSDVAKLLGGDGYPKTGHDLYESLFDQVGSKAEVNLLLQAAGFDGITHIGGQNQDRFSSKFANITDAQQEARRRGGNVKATKSGKYKASGHRVWIAFFPEQVKSAIGNRGTFNPSSAKIDAFKPELKRSRASFGELENEPRGQVAASGLGGLQNLFNRKTKTSASTELVELPKDWDTSKWARKIYTDALSNALSTKDRAELAKLKTDKERNTFLLSAKVDPDVEAKVFKIIDRATDALEKGDGAGVAAARQEAKDLLAGQISSTNRDVKWYDHLQSRLSNVNFKGTYERIAGEQGKEISEIFRNAQVDAANGKLTRSDVVNRLNQELKPYIRRLKSAGKPGLARWVETHIDAVSDPDQSFSGLAGFLKGFQYNTKLRLNPRSALVNSLQPLQTLWPHLTTREWAKLQVEAAKPSTWRRISETAARESGGSVENVNDKKKFMGWADVFTPVSEYNRIVGHLAGELFADRNGLTGDAKARMAADWAKKVEFDNSAYDIPPLFSGKIASVVGQFKPFMVKNIERIVADWKSAPPEALATNTWKGAGTIARRAKMITAQVAIGGVRSAVPGLKTIGGVLILGALAKSFGKFMDDDKAEKLAEAVYFGAPALVEQDLSGSVAVFDEPFGKTAYEKLVNFGGGPTLSLIAKAYEEGKNINEAEDSKNSTKTEKQKAAGMRLAKAVTPYMKTAETAYDLATGKQPELFMGKPKPMTKMEIGGKLLMGTPLRQSKYYEQKEAFDWQKKLMPDRFEKEESKKTRVTEDGKIETRVTKQKPGEPEAVFNKRKTRVEGWMDTYGQKLLDSPRYKAMTDDEQKAAMKLLRNRIGRQQNLKQPKPNSFEPNAVLLGVKKSAATKARRQSKYLYQP